MNLSEAIYQAVEIDDEDGRLTLKHPVPMDDPQEYPWELVRYSGVWYRRRADGSRVEEIGVMSYPKVARLLEEEGYTAG